MTREKTVEEMLDITKKSVDACDDVTQFTIYSNNHEILIYISEKVYIHIDYCWKKKKRVFQKNFLGIRFNIKKRFDIRTYTLGLYWNSKRNCHTLVDINYTDFLDIKKRLISRKKSIIDFEINKVLAEKLDKSFLSYSEFITASNLRDKASMNKILSDVETFFITNRDQDDN
jgi:hypothetical protein